MLDSGDTVETTLQTMAESLKTVMEQIIQVSGWVFVQITIINAQINLSDVPLYVEPMLFNTRLCLSRINSPCSTDLYLLFITVYSYCLLCTRLSCKTLPTKPPPG